jgi:hypothetical protein
MSHTSQTDPTTLTSATPTRTLSKSDYILARTCGAKLYFRENGYPDNRSSDPYLQLLAQGGYMVEALAKAHFPDGIHIGYGRDLAVEFARTMEHLRRDSVTLFEATLVAGRRQARVDILRKTGNIIDLIEVKAKSIDGAEHLGRLENDGKGALRAKRKPHGILNEWREKLEDVTYQVLILEDLLPGVTMRPYLMLVDKSKRSKVDNVPGFFHLLWDDQRDGDRRLRSATYSGSPSDLESLDLLAQIDVGAEVDLLREEVRVASAWFEERLDAPLDAHLAERGARCVHCEFRNGTPGEPNGFADCWGDLSHDSPHLLELYAINRVTAQDGTPIVESLYKKGRASLFDIPVGRLATASGEVKSQALRQRRQIEYTRRREIFVGDDLRSKIDALVYPLHYIDFEVTRLALPYHSGMAPYGQVAFQWSCHTVAHPGAEPIHREWLNAEDSWPNRAFAESLRAAIGDSGSVLTWSHFETTTLKGVVAELPGRGPDAADLIEWIADVDGRTVDMHRWATTDYFHPDMGGRTSIKIVMDALWKADSVIREECRRWFGGPCDADRDPYLALPSLTIHGVEQDVREGTGAMRAYEHMMYGAGRNDPVAREQYRRLLLRYCSLDTLSMVLIFNHFCRVAGVIPRTM